MSEFERLTRNFLAEHDTAELSEGLAALERDTTQRQVYRGLAASERAHAEHWLTCLRRAGHVAPKPVVSRRTRLLVHLARWLGSGFVVPAMTMRELSDHEDYAGQADAAEAGLAAEERGYAEILRAMTGVTVGTSLRAAVLGANDGLVSNFCLMMGVLGGGARTSTLLLTGIAGLVGGALSMALGEWLSVTNARELGESLMDREAREAHHKTGGVHRTPMSGEAWSAARFSFCLFALGAAVPLVPVPLLGVRLAIAGSAALSIAALFGLGLATSLFNGRSPRFSALRQTGIGAAAALATYGVGRLFAMVST